MGKTDENSKKFKKKNKVKELGYKSAKSKARDDRWRAANKVENTGGNTSAAYINNIIARYERIGGAAKPAAPAAPAGPVQNIQSSVRRKVPGAPASAPAPQPAVVSPAPKPQPTQKRDASPKREKDCYVKVRSYKRIKPSCKK